MRAPQLDSCNWLCGLAVCQSGVWRKQLTMAGVTRALRTLSVVMTAVVAKGFLTPSHGQRFVARAAAGNKHDTTPVSRTGCRRAPVPTRTAPVGSIRMVSVILHFACLFYVHLVSASSEPIGSKAVAAASAETSTCSPACVRHQRKRQRSVLRYWCCCCSYCCLHIKKSIPVSAQYLLTSVRVQLTQTLSVVTRQLPCATIFRFKNSTPCHSGPPPSYRMSMFVYLLPVPAC